MRRAGVLCPSIQSRWRRGHLRLHQPKPGEFRILSIVLTDSYLVLAAGDFREARVRRQQLGVLLRAVQHQGVQQQDVDIYHSPLLRLNRQPSPVICLL